jgi:hypothetical protein
MTPKWRSMTIAMRDSVQSSLRKPWARPLTHECDEVLAVFQTEFRLTPTRMRFGVEPRPGMLHHGIAPAPD